VNDHDGLIGGEVRKTAIWRAGSAYSVKVESITKHQLPETHGSGLERSYRPGKSENELKEEDIFRNRGLCIRKCTHCRSV
jgi:hypothetical protein